MRHSSIAKAIAAASIAAAFPFSASGVLAQDTGAAASEMQPEVSVETLTAGEGETPPAGSYVLVNYKGMLTDGTVFDQNERLPLDLNGVVPGFAQGLMQMRRGGIYRLTIPWQLGYGDRASGPIPARSDLIFEVELIDFKTPEELQAMMEEYRKAQEAAVKARIEAAQKAAQENK